MAVEGTRSRRDDYAGQHTGPDTLAGRYLRMFWQPVARSEDLAPGRARPIRIMGEDFTLYRGEGERPHPARLLSQATPASPIAIGEGDQRAPSPAAAGEGGGEGRRPHLLAFRCAHRGTQLSTGWVEGDNLRCFYHGWTYDPTGQCVEQPAEPEPFCQKIRIRSYPAEEHLGLIFAFLGEGEPPPLPRYPAFDEARLHQVEAYSQACNHFNHLDNLLDPAHVPFAHERPRVAAAGGVTSWSHYRDGPLPTIAVEETEWGFAAYTRMPNGVVRVGLWGMPNIYYQKPNRTPRAFDPEPGWDARISWAVPIDDEHHWYFSVAWADGGEEDARRYQQRMAAWRQAASERGHSMGELVAEVLQGRLRVEDAEHMVTREGDGITDAVAELGQGAIANRAQEHLGRSDAAVILRRKMWARELSAFAEGRPLTQWARPERLVPAFRTA